MDTLRKLPDPGPRREALISLVPCVTLAAEIGADHGIISALMLRGGRCQRMIVSDISAASLSKARRLFAAHDLAERTVFRVADGLEALDVPVEAIVIAGMGAGAICRILAAGMARIGDAALILQPNQDVGQLRAWLAAHGFAIEAERIAREGRRFYVILRARRGSARYDDRELLLGPCLLRERPEHFAAYLAWRRDCLGRVRGQDTARDLRWIEEALTTCNTQ